MAESNADKTEAPTPRRRNETRQKGQVARSQDVTAAVLLTVSFLALAMLGRPLWGSLLAIVRACLSPESPTRLDEALVLAGAVCVETLRRLAPILILVFVAIVVALLAQIGLLFTWQPLKPSLSKINPLAGLKRLFSIRSFMLAVINFGKLLVVGMVAYFALSSSASAILFASAFDFRALSLLGWDLLFSLAMKLSAALIVLSLLDFAWQRYKHERDMRMTKEEVKDELRSMEGDPLIKRKRRQVQLQLAVQRLRRDVPQADVIVTNPTHFAVAIAYDEKAMAAPKVLAKGVDEIALRIRQIAAQASIPIVQKPAVARALYEAVDVGDPIPERFYRAIAEILAYVYELSGGARRKRGARSELIGV